MTEQSTPITAPRRTFADSSTDTGDIVKALSRVQAALKPATKNAENPHFGKSYADLSSVWEACQKPLAESEIAILHELVEEGEKLYVRLILMHSTGQYIASRMRLYMQRANDMQALGSTITYARRYLLALLVGVVVDDDDGEASVNHNQRQQQAQRPPQARQAANPNPQNRPPAQGGQQSTAGLPKPKGDGPQQGPAPSKAPPSEASRALDPAAHPQIISQEDQDAFRRLLGAKAPYWDGGKLVGYITAKFKKRFVATLTYEQFTELWDTVEKLTFDQALEIASGSPRQPDPTADRYDKPLAHDDSFDSEVRGDRLVKP